LRYSSLEEPGAKLNRLSQRLRDLALITVLWGQRQRHLLPVGVRNLVRSLAAKCIDLALPNASGRVDEWPSLATLRVGEADTALSHTTVAMGEFGIRPAKSLSSNLDGLWAHGHAHLRCLVATGTLSLGGSEVVALFLAKGLRLHGFDTVVAHASLEHSDESPPDSLNLNGVPLVALSHDNARAWLETHRPDVVSMHNPPDWFVAAAATARVPTIETLHGAHNFLDKDIWPKERLRSRQITGFVAVSELVRRQYLIANPTYPSNRVFTIPNGVDDRHIVQRDRSQARRWLGLGDEFLFVSLARYVLQKNNFGLVSAFSDVASIYPEARLLLAGDIIDQSYYEQVRLLRDRLPCADQIKLYGPCPDVSTVLAAADAFVLDSFFEGWPLASMEALFSGLPVVLSDVGGAREQVGENGIGGFVVGNPLGDPEVLDWPSMARAQFASQSNRSALIKAMCDVVAKRDHWRQARENLKASSANRFSTELCLQRHAEVLRSAASRVSRLYDPEGSLLTTADGDGPRFGR
jgi:glycosyltransferase involved in cell wall biosynthesis